MDWLDLARSVGAGLLVISLLWLSLALLLAWLLSRWFRSQR